MAEIEQLIHAALRVTRGEIDLQDVLNERQSYLLPQVSDCFAQYQNPKDLAFFLALATYSGMEYSAVVQESSKLAVLLFQLAGSEGMGNLHSKGISWLGASREQIEDYFKAQFHRSPKHFEYGEYGVQTIAFRKPGLRQTVLNYAGRAPSIRKPLLSWLRDASKCGDRGMRTQAALTVSELAKQDFELAYRQVLRPWAEESTPQALEMLVWTVGILVREPEHASQVLGVLNYWTRANKASWHRAAARCYGPVGMKYTDEALQNLKELLEKGDKSLRRMASHSLGLIFEEGYYRPELAAYVLSLLQDWKASKSLQIQRLGLSIFLGLAATTTGRAQANCPVVLHLVAHKLIPCELVVTLLYAAWHNKDTEQRTERLLQSWMMHVNRNEDIKKGVDTLVLEMSTQGTNREQALFRRQIRWWAEGRAEPIPYAAKLLQKIDQTR